MHSNFNDLNNENMTAKEFLTSKKVFHGLGVEEDNTTGNSHKIADLMEEYHQAKLKLLGIGDVVEQSEQLVAFCRWYNQAIPSYETTEEEIVETYLRESN